MASTFSSGPPPDAAYLAQSRVPQILFGSIFPAAIATIFSLARFFSRAVIAKTWGWDDTWMLISWLNGGVVLTVLNCVRTRYGSGRHAILLTMFDIQKTYFIGTISRFLYTISLYTTKLSICALYLRLFVDRKDRIIVWLIVVYHTIFTIPIFFAIVFRCSPIEANWSFVPGKCLPFFPPVYASAILNMFGDVALLIFIVPKIYALKLSRKQRNFLIGVMGMGVLVIVASIVRLTLLLQELNVADTDYPYVGYEAIIWTSVEVNTSLICAAAPATRPFIALIAPRLAANPPGNSQANTTARIKARINNYAAGALNISNYRPFRNLPKSNKHNPDVEESEKSQWHVSHELFDLGGLLKPESQRGVKEEDRGSNRDSREENKTGEV